MAMNNGDSSVRVRQLVMVSPTLVDKSGLFQPLDEFMCCHKKFIRIIRMYVKKSMHKRFTAKG